MPERRALHFKKDYAKYTHKIKLTVTIYLKSDMFPLKIKFLTHFRMKAERSQGSHFFCVFFLENLDATSESDADKILPVLKYMLKSGNNQNYPNG